MGNPAVYNRPGRRPPAFRREQTRGLLPEMARVQPANRGGARQLGKQAKQPWATVRRGRTQVSGRGLLKTLPGGRGAARHHQVACGIEELDGGRRTFRRRDYACPDRGSSRPSGNVRMLGKRCQALPKSSLEGNPRPEPSTSTTRTDVHRFGSSPLRRGSSAAETAPTTACRQCKDM